MNQKKNHSANHYKNNYNKKYSQEERSRESYNIKNRQNKKHPLINFLLVLTLVSSLVYFGITIWNGQSNSNFFQNIISSVILVIFSILFVAICVTNPSRKKGAIALGSIFLFSFHVFGSLATLGIVSIPSLGQVENFTGKSLTEVVSWASKNKVTLTQDYEYSDMIPAYHIISQDNVEGSKLKDAKELTVSISEGPNPDKEIIIPDMVSWDSNRVIEYVNDNYLNNVEVEFVESDKAVDTVIEQNNSGSMKRSDKLKLTFSLGEEFDDSDVKIPDFVGMSEFEVTFFLKQHRISYELKDGFSKKIERGKVSKQSVPAGKMVKVDDEDEKVVITISKGESIKVPRLKKMSMVEITNWVVENKLKLEFTNKYDDSVKENHVISANYEEGDKVEQGMTIKAVISKGRLVMQSFQSYEEFRKWAEKYDVAYEERHEFSEDVASGEVISYSYKNGEVIKNGDSIVVTISDGKECRVPNLIGMSKKEVMEALDKLDLEYNFVFQSSSKEKNTAIKQSIRAGSKVSNGTTITVTLSNGKDIEYREEEENSSSSSSDNSNSKPNNGGNSSSGNKDDEDDEDKVVCRECTITGLRNIYNNYMGSFQNTANALKKHITSQCPGIKVVVKGDSTSTLTPGAPISGFSGGNTTSCSTVTITIAQ